MSTTGGLSHVLRQGVHPDATATQKRAALRVAVNEVVGQTFFGSMLKMARESTFKSEFGHGGRGEEMFRGQLDEELVTRISQSSQVGFLNTMYDRMAERYADRIDATSSDATEPYTDPNEAEETGQKENGVG